MPWLAQAVLVLGGALTPLSIAYWRNLDIAVPLTGTTLVALIVATVLDVPAPCDHFVGRTSEHWGSTALSAAPASSVTCFLIVTSGSMWISLAVRERWSGIVSMAALIAAIGAASACFGRSTKVDAAFAMAVGLVVGSVTTPIAWFLGQILNLSPVTSLFIARRLGELAVLLTLGGVIGFGVSFTVSVVDVLLGEHTSSAELTNTLGRGTAKFLVVALPVYMMTCADGI